MSDVAYALATMARDINELRKENKRLRQDLAAARADAKRYRWLRDHATPPTLASIAWGSSIEACDYSNPDEAIDAAIAGDGK